MLVKQERPNNMILLIAGLLGFLSVALGAYADHSLQHTISAADLKSFMTAIKYHQLHAVALVAIGLARFASPKLASSRILLISSFVFLAAIFLFSFGIYTAVIFNLPSLKYLAPFGGTLFMIGWLSLALAGWQLKKT